jgi:hypothetical protein
LAWLREKNNAFVTSSPSPPPPSSSSYHAQVGNTTIKSLNINNTGLGPEGGRLVANGLRGYSLAQYDAKTEDGGMNECRCCV